MTGEKGGGVGRWVLLFTRGNRMAILTSGCSRPLKNFGTATSPLLRAFGGRNWGKWSICKGVIDGGGMVTNRGKYLTIWAKGLVSGEGGFCSTNVGAENQTWINHTGGCGALNRIVSQTLFNVSCYYSIIGKSE